MNVLHERVFCDRTTKYSNYITALQCRCCADLTTRHHNSKGGQRETWQRRNVKGAIVYVTVVSAATVRVVAASRRHARRSLAPAAQCWVAADVFEQNTPVGRVLTDNGGPVAEWWQQQQQQQEGQGAKSQATTATTSAATKSAAIVDEAIPGDCCEKCFVP